MLRAVRTRVCEPARTGHLPSRLIDSSYRMLKPGQQALLVLVHLRSGETFADLASGFTV